MNGLRLYQYAADRLVWLALAMGFLLPSNLMGASEMKLDELRTKTAVYRNVTVTTKATNYVFILHAKGMASLKVADLPTEAKIQLGYISTNSTAAATNTATVWAKRELARLDVPQVKAFRTQVEQKWRGQPAVGVLAMSLLKSKLLYAVLGVFLLLFLFNSYCCMLICRKAGHPPGALIWLPVLQVFPMLRAAGMSLWWFLAFFVPLLNLVPSILWPFKIAKARGKSVWVAVLLLLPFTSYFAFLYLAFSDGGSAEQEEEPEGKAMSLQVV
jgi:hypothetical protein